MLTTQQIQYFDNLPPGKIIEFSKAKDPSAFKQAVLDYIDTYGHLLTICQDGHGVTRCNLPPKKDDISYFFSY